MTCREVAERAGTTEQTINRLENGKMILTAQWMQRIGSALGVPPGELFPQFGGKVPQEVIQSPEEIKVLTWWRRMDRNQKFAVIEFAKSIGLNPTINNYRPKPERASA